MRDALLAFHPSQQKLRFPGGLEVPRGLKSLASSTNIAFMSKGFYLVSASLLE